MRKLLIILVALLVPAGLAYAGLKLGGETLREKSVEINTSSTFGSGVPCPNGSNTQVMYVDSVTGCDADEGFTFTEGTNLVNINEATDGNSILLRLDNDQANTPGSANETAQLRFGFGTDTDVFRIISGKTGDFTSDASSDAFLSFNADADNVSREVMRIVGANDSQNTLGVSIGTTASPGAALMVRNFGGTATSAILVQDSTGTQDLFRVQSDDTATFGETTDVSTFTVYINSTSRSALSVRGGTSDSPAAILMSDDGANSHGFELQNPSAGSFANAHYMEFLGTNKTGVSTEDPTFIINRPLAGETTTLADTTTITNMRMFQIYAPTYNGVSGGGTETITNAATVYIDGAPSGSNITITNPYALWVDSGAIRFDGSIVSATTYEGDITIKKADPSLIYDVTTATDTDFWAGVQDDAGSDDDDLYQIGDGTTPGSNVALTINTSLQTGLGDTTPTATLTVGGHIHTSGTAPTISACGTTPSIVGNDVAGKITVGTGVVTSCTATFASAWTNAPACFANNETQILLTRATSTTTTVVLDAAVTFDADVISYHCMGRE